MASHESTSSSGQNDCRQEEQEQTKNPKNDTSSINNKQEENAATTTTTISNTSANSWKSRMDALREKMATKIEEKKKRKQQSELAEEEKKKAKLLQKGERKKEKEDKANHKETEKEPEITCILQQRQLPITGAISPSLLIINEEEDMPIKKDKKKKNKKKKKKKGQQGTSDDGNGDSNTGILEQSQKNGEKDEALPPGDGYKYPHDDTSFSDVDLFEYRKKVAGFAWNSLVFSATKEDDNNNDTLENHPQSSIIAHMDKHFDKIEADVEQKRRRLLKLEKKKRDGSKTDGISSSTKKKAKLANQNSADPDATNVATSTNGISTTANDNDNGEPIAVNKSTFSSSSDDKKDNNKKIHNKSTKVTAHKASSSNLKTIKKPQLMSSRNHNGNNTNNGKQLNRSGFEGKRLQFLNPLRPPKK